MFATCLSCVGCQKQYPMKVGHYNCQRCNGILQVEYDYQRLSDRLKQRLTNKNRFGIWKYKELLPIQDSSEIVSLREGGTKLLRCKRLGRKLGIKKLYVKDETTNPTGSFKDRPMSVAVTKAKEFRVRAVVTASSGNAGASLSAYAARAGIECWVFVPTGTPPGKICQARAYGSKLVIVNGTYSDAFQLAKICTGELKWFNVTSTFFNPYTVEGDKTIGYEISEQLSYDVPDWVLIPVGAGPLLVGCWRGFKEFESFGWTRGLPSMIAVQAEGCAPIVKAFKEGRSTVEPWGHPRTRVSAIADPLQGYPQDGSLALNTVRQSNGLAEACSDEEIIQAVKLLAETEGIFAEPSGASSIAALKKLLEEGKIRKGETVVCVVTGAGLKDPNASMKLYGVPFEIEPNMDEVRKILKLSCKSDR